jgi:hypothetical protein
MLGSASHIKPQVAVSKELAMWGFCKISMSVRGWFQTFVDLIGPVEVRAGKAQSRAAENRDV